MADPGVRMYRPVAEESLQSLEAFKAAPTTFPKHQIRLRKKNSLSATVIESKESRARNGIRGNPDSAGSVGLRQVIYPIPKTAAESLTVNVLGVNYFGPAMGRRALSLVLEDEDRVLENERREYITRMGKQFARLAVPHVTVLNLDRFFATSDVLAWAESVAPKTITLDPMKTHPFIEEPHRKPQRKKMMRPEAHSELHHTPDLSAIPIRNLANTPKIPQGLLSSIRPSS